MSDALLVVAMAAITFSSRAVFLIKPTAAVPERFAGFLNRFPLALFTSLATATLLVPEASVGRAEGYAAFACAVAAAFTFRGSLPAVLAGGGAAYWVVRLLGA